MIRKDASCFIPVAASSDPSRILISRKYKRQGRDLRSSSHFTLLFSINSGRVPVKEEDLSIPFPYTYTYTDKLKT